MEDGGRRISFIFWRFNVRRVYPTKMMIEFIQIICLKVGIFCELKVRRKKKWATEGVLERVANFFNRTWPGISVMAIFVNASADFIRLYDMSPALFSQTACLSLFHPHFEVNKRPIQAFHSYQVTFVLYSHHIFLILLCMNIPGYL